MPHRVNHIDGLEKLQRETDKFLNTRDSLVGGKIKDFFPLYLNILHGGKSV